MCFIYDNCPEAYSECVTKARKRHPCESCSRGIEPGERYVDHTGIFEDEPFRYRTCGRCELDRWIIYINERGEGCSHHESWISYDDLHEYRSDHEMTMSDVSDGQRYLALRDERSQVKIQSLSELGVS